MTYSLTNLATLLLEISSLPNFRPTFKYYCWPTSLLGSTLTLAVMFYLNPMYATVTMIVVMSLFVYISLYGPTTSWGDMLSQAVLFHQARRRAASCCGCRSRSK